MPPAVCDQAAFGTHLGSRWLASSRCAQVNALVEALQLAAALPLHISLNEQGGKVRRWKPAIGFPPTGSAPCLGEWNALDRIRQQANMIAPRLAELGS